LEISPGEWLPAAWTIAYGGIQAVAPALVSSSSTASAVSYPRLAFGRWSWRRFPIALAAILNFTDVAHREIVLLIGLSFFGLPFAVNSSLHSYLMLAYAGSEKAAEDVGFYYAANVSPEVCSVSPCQVLSISSAE
jgi:hypothetical protein